MEDARFFMVSTEPATASLFKTLSHYGHHKINAFVELINSANLGELETNKNNYSSVNIAREVISGSILQIAFMAIKVHCKPGTKSSGALHFEAEINRMLREEKNSRKKHILLPPKFCVGRELGDLPIGMVIYAARNQYNHFDEKRLSVVNEVVFNYLHIASPNPPNDLSFNLYDHRNYYCYSCLVALGWTDSENEPSYNKYKRDISAILEIKF